MKRLAAVFCLLTPLVLSQDAGTDTEFKGRVESLVEFMKKTTQSKPTQAWTGTIRKTIERKGTFVPAEYDELKLDLKVYGAGRGSELRLVEILPHGSFVNEGDIIARLETKGIDKQIVSDRMSLARAEMGMRQEEEKSRMKSDTDAEALTRAEVDSSRATKKLRGYREHEKRFNEESERMSVQYRSHRLEDQKDELDQLEKMYGEDELVDATEEIVLKRSRRNFARSQQSRDLSEARRLYNKEWFFEWREEDLEREAQRKASALERVRKSQAMGRERTEADLKKKRWDLQQQKDRFADLERDRAQFVIRAPRRGILLHGAADKAPWGRMKKGGTLRNRTVFATVADPKKFKVKTDIPEADILTLKSGTAVEVSPVAAADLKFMGRLEVDYLPAKGNVFPATIRLGKVGTRLRPGLTCTVKVIVEEERDAVLVPKTALIEKDGETIIRCAKTQDSAIEFRKVRTGVSDGTNIAIRDGVVAGEYIVVPQGAAKGGTGQGGGNRKRKMHKSK